MESKFLRITNKSEWQNLLNKVFFKTFFHNLEWEEFLEQQFKWLKFERYLYKDQALLSLARVKVFGKEKLISHPFCEYGGPLPLIEKIEGEKFQKDLFEFFKAPIKISFHPHIVNHFHFTRKLPVKFGRRERVSYFIENFDQKTKEELWRNLRKTTRQEIKKAQNRGLKVKDCKNEKELKDFYNLYLLSAKKHKIPAYPFSFFEYFLDSPWAEIILAQKESKVVAGSIFLKYQKILHYFLNASHLKIASGANHLILWHQIEKYIGKDIEIFDFGGTRRGSSLEIFKRGWGGKEVSILEYRYLLANSKLESSFLRKIWGMLPIPLIKFLSPHLLKFKL